MPRDAPRWLRSTASVVGVISDTHGLLRPEALDALRDCELILHAGDVGRAETFETLRAGVPRLIAVRGNVDAKWACDLPERVFVRVRGRRVALLHEIAAWSTEEPRVDVVVTGHSHKPRIERRDEVLYVNPGSAGPRRFRLPVTVARLTFDRDDSVAARIVELRV